MICESAVTSCWQLFVVSLHSRLDCLLLDVSAMTIFTVRTGGLTGLGINSRPWIRGACFVNLAG